MKLSELNPMLCYTEQMGHELTLNCPYCGDRFPIHVNYMGAQKDSAIWGLTYPEGEFNWDRVTLMPSISNHPLARGRVCRQPHFSVINGEIIP